MGVAAEPISQARIKRLRYVESVLLWEGLIQRQRVCNVFGVTANHVTKDLRMYCAAHPGGIEFQPRLRGYVASKKFKPVYASDDPNEYLALLQAQAETGSAALMPMLGSEGLSCDALPQPSHSIDRTVLRCVIQAMRGSTGIDIVYNSMSSDKPSERTLWPHSLLHSGYGWYARAYDSKREEFRDFMLQRISEARPTDTPSPVAADDDTQWSTMVTAEVIPHPKLNAHQKGIVAREYGMKQEKHGPIWRVELRQALVGYFAVRHNLVEPSSSNPREHRILLGNHAALERFFLSAKVG